jgi:hypothetical protein
MERKIHGVNGTYGSYTESLGDSHLVEDGDSPLTDEPPVAESEPAHQSTRYLNRKYSVRIPDLPDVDISNGAVQQLQGLYDTANRNATQGVPLDQRDVSIVARGYVETDNRLMIDGFNVRRHLSDTQRAVIQGSRWGSGVLSLMGAIIGGILYTQDNTVGAYSAWVGSLVALWPVIENYLINRCKSPDFILGERELDPALVGQYQV